MQPACFADGFRLEAIPAHGSSYAQPFLLRIIQRHGWKRSADAMSWRWRYAWELTRRRQASPHERFFCLQRWKQPIDAARQTRATKSASLAAALPPAAIWCHVLTGGNWALKSIALTSAEQDQKKRTWLLMLSPAKRSPGQAIKLTCRWKPQFFRQTCRRLRLARHHVMPLFSTICIARLLYKAT